jgi:hypothetical protein
MQKMDKMIISIFSHRTLHIRDHFPIQIPRPSTERRITEKGTGGRRTKKNGMGKICWGEIMKGKNIDECWLWK